MSESSISMSKNPTKALGGLTKARIPLIKRQNNAFTALRRVNLDDDILAELALLKKRV
jgi:hypothetical protein